MTNQCEKHHNEIFNYDKAIWEKRGESDFTQCSYCGSLSVSDAIKLLKTPDTDFSGSDWKYGWPHKFYIKHKKFYNEHLLDANEDEFKEFNELSRKLFGIEWSIKDGKIGYKCPNGIQLYGVVGRGDSMILK